MKRLQLLLMMAFVINVAWADVQINEKNFPDTDFRNWLIDQEYGADKILTDEEISGITSLVFSNIDIKSLRGIEYFTSLEELSFFNTQLSVLDVLNHPNLKRFYCNDNELTSLNVSGCTALQELECRNNQLTSLNVSGCTALSWLDCSFNKLNALDLSQNTNLSWLRVLHNQIQGAAMDALIEGLPILDNINNRYFYVYSKFDDDEQNEMTRAQVVAATTKGWIPYYVANINIGQGKYYGTDDSDEEFVEINEINFPDEVFRNWLLSQKYGSDGLMSDIELADVKKISIEEKKIQNLKGIEFFTALRELVCRNNLLTSLDLTHNTMLTSLICYDNLLTTLDLSNNTRLKTLNCYGNQLTALNVSGCKSLSFMYCYKNQISDAGMDDLVESLPTVNGVKLYVIYQDPEYEHNAMTTAQVAVARAKGWIPCYNKGQEYAGSDYIQIKNITFADATVKSLCVTNWDTDGDGELSKDEAAAVTSIGTVFKENTEITSFDELQYFTGITAIDKQAFFECSGLTSVTMPKSVTALGEGAFYHCSDLTAITIPKSVISIGNSVFGYCSNLASIQVENGNAKYDSRNGCNAIIETATNTLVAGCKNTIIPNGITAIGYDAFFCCIGLTAISIPNSVTTIGNYAFYGCSGITSLTIPEGVSSIGYFAFDYCSGLSYVKIPESVTSIGSSAFAHCNLSAIHITNLAAWCHISFEDIEASPLAGRSLYVNNQEITDLIIPEDVTEISNYAFVACSSLTSITLHKNITNIGYDAFRYCRPTSVNINTPSVLRWFNNSETLERVEFGESVTSIGSSAFSGCTALKSIQIPNNVKQIDSNAFKDCKKLKSVFIDCETVDKWFAGLTSIETLVLGENVNLIKAEAFSGCLGLSSVTIGNNVTSILSKAFYNCKALTSISIPKSVTNIGDLAFYNSALCDVYCYAEEPPSTGSLTFNQTQIATATLHVPATSLEAYQAAARWAKFGTIVAIDAPEKVLVETFTLNCKRGYVGYNGSILVGTTKDNASELAIIEYNNTNYLYDVTNSAFVIYTMVERGDRIVANTCLESSIDLSKAITGLTWGETGLSTYPWYIEDRLGNWMNMNQYPHVYMNTWQDFEGGNGGNTYQVEVVNPEYDATEALRILENYFNPESTVTYVFTEPGNVVTRSKAYPTFIGTVISSVPYELQKSYCRYQVTNTTMHAGENEVTIKVSYTMPFTISESYEEASWYYAKIRNSYYMNVGDSEPYYPTIDNPQTDNYMWAFMGTPHSGFVILNKAAGATNALTRNNIYVVMRSGDVDKWDIIQNGEGFNILLRGSDADYINQKGNSSGPLGIWHDQRGSYNVGSQWLIEAAESGENSYMLTYMVDGEVYKTSTVVYGTNLTPEATPRKEGYTFGGWSEIPATMPAHDVTITGTFTVNKYKILYYVGEQVWAEDEVEYGAKLTLRDYTPEDANRYSFVGWDGKMFETMPAKDIEYRAIIVDGISGLNTDTNGIETIYDGTGRKLSKMQRGVNVLMMKDGTTRKVFR